MAEKIRLEDRECPLSATLGMVGEWWTLLILHDVFDGFSRFDQFQENLGISSSLLTSRLKRLVANGLLERRQYQPHPPRDEYVLTDLGRSLRPVIVALAAWGNARLAPEERSMVLVDVETGVEAEPVVVDRATGRRVDGPDFVFTAGPAGSKPFRDRYEGRPRPGAASELHSAEREEAMAKNDPRTDRILSRVRRIPSGRVRTYGDIDPDAPRIVGRVLQNEHDGVPWHRVVRADGSLPMGDRQRVLLRAERVPMKGDRVDLRSARVGATGEARRSRPSRAGKSKLTRSR
jgi:DNA-binding HxlR family transcriptional regulator/alkylated DNA nucleotide flippase Atl1